jgi:hypothetical protein
MHIQRVSDCLFSVSTLSVELHRYSDIHTNHSGNGNGVNGSYVEGLIGQLTKYKISRNKL